MTKLPPLTLKSALSILSIVLLWRVALFGISTTAPLALEYRPSFPYADSLLASSGLPKWLYSWANFDGVHYLTIIGQGYKETGLIQAFFPAYPYLIKMLSTLTTISPIIIGQLVSYIAISAASLIWWYWSPRFLRQLPVKVNRFRWSALLILLLFPTSFFFAGLYTESLFFLLSIGSLVLILVDRIWAAGLLAGLASATRISGIFLVPALLVEVWWQPIQIWLNQLKNDRSLKQLLSPSLLKTSLILIILGSLGLLTYSGYLLQEFNDPLYYFSVQSEFGAGREESIILYPQTAWRSLNILLTARPFDFKYYAYVQEFLVGLGGLVLLILAYKKVRPSVWLFSLLCFLLPTLTGSFSSMPRYVLACYAIFLLLAVWLHSRPRWLALYLLLSTIFLIINTMLFVQGYWVA